MKIAVIRGDFANPWEAQNFLPLVTRDKVVFFTGYFPVAKVNIGSNIIIKKLLSPVDLNFGKISKLKMALLNRLFIDAHLLLGLEKNLQGFDIAHCAETYFGFTQQAINAKKRGKVKIVVSTVWENILNNNESIKGRTKYKQNAFNNIDLFLPVTQRSADVLKKEGCPPEKIRILNPGVDINNFKPRKSFNTKLTRQVNLLTVGRLVPEKGIIELINYIKDLKSQNMPIKFTIVGDGPLAYQIENEINKSNSGVITLIKKVNYDQMPSVFNSADIYLHFPIGSNTWQEQYGMVLLEAMASGLPIVTLNEGSVGEVVGSGGIVAARERFMESLKSVILDAKLRHKLAVRARERAVLNFSTHVYAKKLRKIYLELLKINEN